jgi:peptide/nickel transport system substrate-binding protein
MAKDEGQHNDRDFDLSFLETQMQRRATRRDVLKGAAGVGAALSLGPLFAACGGGDGGTTASPTAAGTPKKGGHLRVGMSMGGTNIDPQLSTTGDVIGMDHTVFEGLTTFDPTMKLVNQLAEEVSPNDAATEYTVRLQPGVTFHNGKSLTADDVIFSFERILDPKAPKVGASSLSHLERMKKVDDLTVQMYLARPDAIFPELLAMYSNCILPTGFKTSSKAADLIGTGPFKMTGYTQLQEADFASYADYWGQVPYIDTMTWYSVSESNALVDGLSGGTYDWVMGLSPTQGKVLDQSDGVSTVRSTSGTYTPFMMRADVKPFDDVRVRQAFKLICPRQKTLDATLAGAGGLGNDITALYDPAYPKDLEQTEQDLEQAASLLKQAGYGDGLSVECVVCPENGASAVDCAVIFAEEAKKVGVTVKVNKVDVANFYGENWTTYPFSTDSWATRNYILAARIQRFSDAVWNCEHWQNDQWESAMREAEQTVDEAKRNELIAEAMKIDHDEAGYLVWSFMDLIDGKSDKVAGEVPDVFYWTAINFGFKYLYFV